MDFKLPELGEEVEGGDIINITVSEGDKVKKEQTLMEIETDKAVIELPAPVGGTITKLHVKQGENVKIGQLLVTFDSEGGQTETTAPKEKESKSISKSESENEKQESAKEVSEEVSEPEQKQTDEKESSNNQDSETDNVISIAAKEDKKSESTEDDVSTSIIPASPSVRRLAREIGVDISMVDGSGPGGRISEEDVKEFARSNMSESVKESISDFTEAKVQTTKAPGGSVEDMSKVRTITAQRLTEAWKAPHVTQHDKADITDIEKIRKQYSDQVKHTGGKLSMTSILTKICAHALNKFPNFNSSIDMEKLQIIYNADINIGIAVDTDRGLLVPVVKNANKKNITQISVEISDLSERSRNKKIKVEELQGSTFTISNLGGIGGTYFTPILNPPNVAILGVSRAVIEPVYIDGEFNPRLMIPLSLSYDHRIIDGADAIRFMRWIIEAIENPFLILLDS